MGAAVSRPAIGGGKFLAKAQRSEDSERGGDVWRLLGTLVWAVAEIPWFLRDEDLGMTLTVEAGCGVAAEEIPGDFHMAEVLGKLFVGVDEGGALGPVCGSAGGVI